MFASLHLFSPLTSEVMSIFTTKPVWQGERSHRRLLDTTPVPSPHDSPSHCDTRKAAKADLLVFFKVWTGTIGRRGRGRELGSGTNKGGERDHRVSHTHQIVNTGFKSSADGREHIESTAYEPQEFIPAISGN